MATDLRPADYQQYKGQRIIGLLMSEKKHGIWAKWDGKNFYTRNGKVLNAPAWFKSGLPNKELIGELFCGYGNFQILSSRLKNKTSQWDGITFELFDDCSDVLPAHVSIIPQIKIESVAQKDQFLKEILAKGGEGVVIRGADWSVVYKEKPKQSLEAICVGIKEGTGRLAGKIGSLICQLNDVQFNVSSGLDDFQRGLSHAEFIGKKITVEFMNLTDAGKPFQPCFVGHRFDL